MNNKLDQVPEEFKKLADDFSKNGFITTSFDNLINSASIDYSRYLFFYVNYLLHENKKDEAKKLSEFRTDNLVQKKVLAKDKTTLFENTQDKDELNIIIKSDVQGSSEALKMAINKIEHKEVEAKIILSDIGMINETDVSLAKASNAILIGFNVKPNREAKKLAEDQKIDIKYLILFMKH